MVIQKRLDYGFNGYQVPAIPQASRSTRKRCTIQKNQMHAFDLLATVAGKLLLEEDNHPSSFDISNGNDDYAVVKKEWLDDDVSNLFYENRCQNPGSKSSLVEKNGDLAEFISTATVSCTSKRFIADNLANDQKDNEVGSITSKADYSDVHEKSSDRKLDRENKLTIEDSPQESGEVLTSSAINACKLEDLFVKEQKPCGLTCSNIGSKGPLSRDHSTQISSPTSRDNEKVDGRDDDENSSGCTHPKFFSSCPYIGGQIIRKVLASKKWKVTKKYRDETVSNIGGNSNFLHNHCKRKNGIKRHRTQMNIPFKKRKLFEKVTGTSSSVSDRHPSLESGDSYVKLRITSFKVPEIFFEIPETATVGSLKRRVMETLTSILGGELRIGVLVRGKKVRDDSKTLFQSGISRNDQLDSLGFTLEPHYSQTPTSLCYGNSLSVLPCKTRYPIANHSHMNDVLMLEPHLANHGSSVESDHDSAPSPIHTPLDQITTSKTLVSVPAMAVEALAVVPMHRKPKRSEIVPRRIRRPFTVAEVEALVQAVERLGTGRWRDVKLRAFDNAKHRTYVDLKDKWKTLVHTARIAPQQRRGEAVPQELLDRVLNAHAYWSQPQRHTQALPSPLKAF